MIDNTSDIELIRRVLRENDSRAFGALMNRYTAQVYRAVLRLLKDEDNAAEVTQMAFIQAYKQLSSWRGENFGAWVTIIANHMALRLLEKDRFRTGASQPFGSGKVSMGTLRKTFIFDENGILERIIDKVDTKNHTEQIL